MDEPDVTVYYKRPADSLIAIRETIEDVCLNITTESTTNYVNQTPPHATTAEITYTILHYDSFIP